MAEDKVFHSENEDNYFGNLIIDRSSPSLLEETAPADEITVTGADNDVEDLLEEMEMELVIDGPPPLEDTSLSQDTTSNDENPLTPVDSAESSNEDEQMTVHATNQKVILADRIEGSDVRGGGDTGAGKIAEPVQGHDVTSSGDVPLDDNAVYVGNVTSEETLRFWLRNNIGKVTSLQCQDKAFSSYRVTFADAKDKGCVLDMRPVSLPDGQCIFIQERPRKFGDDPWDADQQVFLPDLDPTFRESDLRTTFASHGKVIDAVIREGPKGVYGLIVFETYRQAMAVVEKGVISIGDKKITVVPCKAKHDRKRTYNPYHSPNTGYEDHRGVYGKRKHFDLRDELDHKKSRSAERSLSGGVTIATRGGNSLRGIQVQNSDVKSDDTMVDDLQANALYFGNIATFNGLRYFLSAFGEVTSVRYVDAYFPSYRVTFKTAEVRGHVLDSRPVTLPDGQRVFIQERPRKFGDDLWDADQQVFLPNLDPRFREQDIMVTFASYGNVVDAVIREGPKGVYGLVAYETSAQARDVAAKNLIPDSEGKHKILVVQNRSKRSRKYHNYVHFE